MARKKRPAPKKKAASGKATAGKRTTKRVRTGAKGRKPGEKREASDVRGFGMLSTGVSQTIKSMGDALAAAARKG